jgi:hypothetical protein
VPLDCSDTYLTYITNTALSNSPEVMPVIFSNEHLYILYAPFLETISTPPWGYILGGLRIFYIENVTGNKLSVRNIFITVTVITDVLVNTQLIPL